MSDSLAVEFHQVSKLFSLERTRGPRSFQETVIGLFRSGTRRRRFWGLHDVSFALEKGKTFGFIGPNGAGKSTALKLIARILEPSSGHVSVHGSVGALLELGAGFHPDLTGRENVHLSGSLMGLSREYMHGKFDEIVAFSELEDFIDMPVKHYSSGMYVRLGFSVAVHTQPDLLLVDEVLAVGDQAFQHKCLSRISQLRRSGVTIVLVSHDLDTIQAQCDEVLWFSQGSLKAQGPTVDAVMGYLRHSAQGERSLRPHVDIDEGGDSGAMGIFDQPEPIPFGADAPQDRRWGTGKVKITAVEFCDESGRRMRSFVTGETLAVTLHYEAAAPVDEPIFGLAIHHQNGTHICGPNSGFGNLSIPHLVGRGSVTYQVDALPLLPGGYQLSVSVHDKDDLEMYDYHDRLYPLQIYPGHAAERYGLLALGGTWRHCPSHSARDH